MARPYAHMISSAMMVAFLDQHFQLYASSSICDGIEGRRKRIGRKGATTYVVLLQDSSETSNQETTVYEGPDPEEAVRQYNALG